MIWICEKCGSEEIRKMITCKHGFDDWFQCPNCFGGELTRDEHRGMMWKRDEDLK